MATIQHFDQVEEQLTIHVGVFSKSLSTVKMCFTVIWITCVTCLGVHIDIFPKFIGC